MSIYFYDFITPIKLRDFTTNGSIKSTVISLTACNVATAAPTPYSDPTKLIPLIPPGAAPRIVVMISTPSKRLVQSPIARPVITNVKVINIAGFHNICSSFKESFVKDVPITVPIPISNIVLVPTGQFATSIFPLRLKILAPSKAPANGAAGIPVFKASNPIKEPAKA